ncbi:hypothetical protein Q5H93_05480 [Hymenobacter sp. ASUV-10]|uniref:Glycosyltransferase RgtA/B/C/D-like domain-containing protein n=1 Tax=Hymenobacter aranciens TaxID=3063996 RepID=A0ABT9B7C5_9BACT|nr:hypothetical protein [Hymenobacter sp. ASUV-10]MDO7874176.1 hypothetical protein [Hymenobacter sp. ASUV-10]
MSLKFLGAIAVGVIYQFYYRGGDTYNYFYHSSVIYDALTTDFGVGLKLIMTSGGLMDPKLAPYYEQMYWYQEGSQEYLISRISAVFGLFNYHTYTVIALMFAGVSFSGIWAFYITFVKLRPGMYKQLAIALFFVPSLFFWGSGLGKDSLCIGALGWVFYAFYRGAIQRRRMLQSAIIGVFAAYAIFLIKVYILLCFLPAALLWVFNENSSRIKNSVIRWVSKPLFFAVGGALAFYAATTLTKGDDHYDVEKIGERSKITADYIYSVSVQQEGSGYKLGELDGTIGGMAKLAPMAIITSLYRPFLWEAKNPVMLLSALEAMYFLVFTLRIFFRVGFFKTLRFITTTPVLSLSFLFSLIFAASVGVSTSNFGTLVRYKIPLIPFYLSALYILDDITKESARNAKRERATQRALEAA